MKKIKEKILKFGLYRFLIILLCLISLVGLFLPYEASVGKFRDSLNLSPNSYAIKDIDFKNSDMVDISIVDNFKVFNYLNNNIDNNKIYSMAKAETILNTVLIVMLISSIVLILLFAFFKKYVLSLICSILMASSSLLMNFDLVSRGIVPSSNYTFGISYYLFVIAAILIFAFSIAGIINKKKNKKNLIKNEQEKQDKQEKEI